MQCPKCGVEARDSDIFCRRCHATLRYKCPSCANVQSHGGNCDKCGIDFAKYAGVLMAQNQVEVNRERDRLKHRSGLLKTLILMPLDGGISFFRFLFRNR